MEIPILKELRIICAEIDNKNLDASQWSEIESDDMFQSGNFVGGFDADEQEFCFSYNSPNDIEYWFQFNLEIAKKISQGQSPILTGRKVE